MRTVSLLLCFFTSIYGGTFAQTSYSAIASNRMIQKHHVPERIQKIAQIDPQRLQVLWNYFSNSFSFNSEETGLTVQNLLNIQHFDITEFEHLRQAESEVQFIYRGSILITLKSGAELNNLLQGYELNALVNELPARDFPQWVTGADLSENNFQNYKEQVWDWAKDYPAAYLQLTADLNRIHIRFDDLKALDETRRTSLLNGSNYLIID